MHAQAGGSSRKGRDSRPRPCSSSLPFFWTAAINTTKPRAGSRRPHLRVEETYPASPPTPPPSPSASNLPPSRIPPTPLPPEAVSAEDIRYVNTHPPPADRSGPGHVVHRALQRTTLGQRRSIRRYGHDGGASDAAHGIAHRGYQPHHRPVGRHAHQRSGPVYRRPRRRPDHRGIGHGHGRLPRWNRSPRQGGCLPDPPSPSTAAGMRWCVQIGAFHSEHQAIKLKVASF